MNIAIKDGFVHLFVVQKRLIIYLKKECTLIYMIIPWVLDLEGHFVVMSFHVFGRTMHVTMYSMKCMAVINLNAPS